MSYICGVDLGGKRARLCFVDPTDVKHPMMVRFEPTPADYKAKTYLDCAKWAANSAPPVWHRMDPLVVWFEQPFGPGRTVHQLSLMAGALMSGLSRTVGVEFVPAVECRRLVGLSGKITKAESIAWAEANADADFSWDHHDSDAYIVAMAILAHGARSAAA